MSHKLLLPLPAAATARLRRVTEHLTNVHHQTSQINMTQKSYAAGSAFPPLKPGVMRIYSMRFCPWAERTRLVLEHKNIPYETVNIDLKDKPEWFLEKNPLGLVPVLEIDDKIVYESTATADWLDDTYPENRLQPADPYKRAWDRILVEYYGKLAATFFVLMRNPENGEQAVADLQKHFLFFENVLTKREGPFFGDNKPALVDFMIWPHFERIPILATQEPRAEIDKEKFPRLVEWFQSMSSLPAVKSTAFDISTHLAFIESYRSGNKPNYDIGLEE